MNTTLPRLLRHTTALAVIACTCATFAATPNVLVVSVTKGFRHDVIPTVDALIQDLARQSGKFTVDYARTDEQLAAKLTPAALAQYGAVILNNTSGDLPLPDREGFLAWVRSGKGFVGFHAATDTLGGFPEFVEMIGGQFDIHHEQVEVDVRVEDPKHPATAHFPSSFRVMDEIYLFKNFHRAKVHGLLTMDRHPNFGQPGDYPVAWCKDYGKGRVIYSSLGHRTDVVQRADVKQHYLGAILWAVGAADGDAKPQSTQLKLTPAEVAEGFKPLFNGVDLTGWKLRNPSGKASWSAQNGMLVNTIAKDEHGTDLVTNDKFWNFTVRYEYMVPSGANSGFYLRGRHELQILDDHAQGKPSTTGNGSFYNFAAPLKFTSKPAGQWNSVEATLVGNQVTVIHNGEKIHDQLVIDRPTGGELDGNLNAPGPIFLQGDHGAVAFRNLRIRILPER
jgi:type 1 glutamine amidotransferase